MDKSRLDNINEIVSRRTGGTMPFMGVTSKEGIQYTIGMLPKDSPERKLLEEQGYIFVYPKVPEKIFDEEQATQAKWENENYCMILDKFVKNPPRFDTLRNVDEFYHKFEKYKCDLGAVDVRNGNKTVKYRVTDDVKEIYDKIGAQYEIMGDELIIPDGRFTVKKGKMATFYENAKGKMKQAFDRLKGVFNKDKKLDISRDSNDTNDSNEER